MNAMEIFSEAFHATRTPRSQAYREGVMAALRYRTGETDRMACCPYTVGTAEADAWFSGVEEGHALYRWRKEARR